MSENLLAGRIAQLRKEAGMTQEQLGNALGLTYQSVSKWETGTADPSTSNLLRWRSCSAYPRRSCCGRWTGRTRKKTESNGGGPQGPPFFLHPPGCRGLTLVFFMEKLL